MTLKNIIISFHTCILLVFPTVSALLQHGLEHGVTPGIPSRLSCGNTRDFSHEAAGLYTVGLVHSEDLNSLELHSTPEKILQRDLRNTYFDYMLFNIPEALIFIKAKRFTLSLMEVTLLVSSENVNCIIAQL